MKTKLDWLTKEADQQKEIFPQGSWGLSWSSHVNLALLFLSEQLEIPPASIPGEEET
jgi:hypothetical protein